jgi:hypothetical protein
MTAHHRSSSCGYWAQPRAALSKDGRLVLFASDWGLEPCRQSDLGSPDPYLLFVGAWRAGASARSSSTLARSSTTTASKRTVGVTSTSTV